MSDEQERRARATIRRYEVRRTPRTVFARTKSPPCIIRPEYRGMVGALRELSEKFGGYFDDVDPVEFVREMRADDGL